MKECKFHKGFGLIEVLFAAVVLGFLLVGLNLLQKGNRESILRVRARDAANVIAQEVIDSISTIGSASVLDGKRTGDCVSKPSGLDDLCRTREFKGMAGNTKIDYSIEVDVPATNIQTTEEATELIKNLVTDKPDVNHKFAKQVDVEVKWKFKNSSQSIKVSSVVR